MIKALITNKLIMNKTSTRMEMNPVNKPFFLKKILLITLNLVLFTNWFLQNGLQKSKLLFLLIIISLLLLWLILVRIWIVSKKDWFIQNILKNLLKDWLLLMVLRWKSNINWIMLMCAMIMSISRFLLFLLKIWLIKWFLVCFFINALYPFLVEHDGIITDPFG